MRSGARSLAIVWWGIPFFAITLLAALQSIPRDIYEAAAIDGAGADPALPIASRCRSWRRPIAITVLLRTVWIANSADLIVVMTRGGPADSTQIMASYIFTQAFQRLDFGYASALVGRAARAAARLCVRGHRPAADASASRSDDATLPPRAAPAPGRCHYGLLALYVAFALFPLFWLFKVSVTPNDLLYSEGVRLWPSRIEPRTLRLGDPATPISRCSSATA